MPKNDDDRNAQAARMLSHSKGDVWLNAHEEFPTDYSVLDTLTLQEVFEGSRAGGKTLRMKELLKRWRMHPKQVRFLSAKPDSTFTAGYGRRELGNVVFDELAHWKALEIMGASQKTEFPGMVAGEWFDGTWMLGIDWAGPQPSYAAGYKVVRGVSQSIIQFERIDSHGASRQDDATQCGGTAGRARLRTSTVGPLTGRRYLRLHQLGANVSELLRGIRAEATDGAAVARHGDCSGVDRNARKRSYSGRRWGLA